MYYVIVPELLANDINMAGIVDIGWLFRGIL